MIHRGKHNIPYGFMGLVTLTAGAFTYVTYHDYAMEVSNNLSDALDSVQSSELFIPADQDSLKDSMIGETQNNNDEIKNTEETFTLDNAEKTDVNDEKVQSVEGEKDVQEVVEKETPKESDPEEIDPKNQLKRVGQQDKENRKTENSPKIQSETDEPTKTNIEGKKGGSSKNKKKKTIKHRKVNI